MDERTSAALLRLKPCAKEPYPLEHAAKETTERFFCAAKHLQPEGFLGWQMEFASGEKPAIFALSDPRVRTEQADFSWMFFPCAEVEPASATDPFGEGRQVYELRSVSGDADDVPRVSRFIDGDDMLPYSRRAADALSELSAAKAILRLTAGSGHGKILLGLPDEMSLRLRAMLSMAFPHTEAEEASLTGDVGQLPARELAERFNDLLRTALYLYADEPAPSPDDAKDAEERAPDGETSIE